MLSKIVRALCAATLLAAVLSVPVSTRSAGAESCWSWTAAEKELARRTNAARTHRGKTKLRLDPELSKVAKVHSREMARENRLYHTPRSVLTDRVTRWRRLGENVATGQSIGAIQRAFMRSKTHRANILDGRYRHFGIGTLRSEGKMWVTVVFSARRDPGTTLRMPC